YAGKIYKGQGRTLDQTYLYHSKHWRAEAGYVAMTRHRDTAAVFVAKETAGDLDQLADMMSRSSEKRAASQFVEVVPTSSTGGADRPAAQATTGTVSTAQPVRPQTPADPMADLLRKLAGSGRTPAPAGKY